MNFLVNSIFERNYFEVTKDFKFTLTANTQFILKKPCTYETNRLFLNKSFVYFFILFYRKFLAGWAWWYMPLIAAFRGWGRSVLVRSRKLQTAMHMDPSKSPLLKLVTEDRLLSQRTQLSTPMPFYSRSFPARKGAPFDLLSILQALPFGRKEKPH